MQLGINWVALALIVGVYVVMRMRSLSLAARYLISGALYFGVAASILAPGVMHPVNLAIAGLTVVLGISYFVKGFKARRGP